MKILEILKDSAMLLNLFDAASVLDNDSLTDTEKQANKEVQELVNFADMSVKEICSNYLPYEVESSITTTDKKYPLNSLNNLLRVVDVKKGDNYVDFKIISRNLVFDEDGTYTVIYNSYPTITSLSDDLSFLQRLGTDVVVYAVCAYYCLAKGMFEEFDSFYGQYNDRASAIKDVKTFIMPQRRWE